MPEELQDPWAKQPVVPVPAEPAGPRSRRSRRGSAGDGGSGPPRKRKRHPWYWWLANLMILAGVLFLPAYFLSTCAVTAVHQNQLEKQLQTSNPQMANATTGTGDFYKYQSTTTTLPPSATQQQVTAAEAAIAQAKAEREAKLAAFKAAADAFEKTVTGKAGAPVGRIQIPAIGVNVIIVQGTGVPDLKKGPGHWEETPFPGQNGNFVISGHRTTYGAPFFKLNDLKPGDEIDVILPYAVCKYTVSETLIVLPTQLEAVAQAGREQISLAACHPIYSAKQRIVVKGELTSFSLLEPAGQTGQTGQTTPSS